MDKDNIKEKVFDRVNAYADEPKAEYKEKWYKEWFLLLLGPV